MTPIGLFYGSNTDYTRLVVDQIIEEFELVAPNLLTIHNVAKTPLDKMLTYDFLIIGCPTWNIGQLQDDWDNHFLELDSLHLVGKQIAIFGLGDQYGYPESFCDAIGILGRKFIAQGAELVGYTSTNGYEFSYSAGVEDDRFMGLALDDENDSEATPDRISEWIWQLVDEFDLVRFLEPIVG
ncbi:MAG: flavodoxin [Ardenticatenaceae bacterium]|nr:flavodoxin [Anaerolineales bacterium]MCB8940509.1 flavodoxin [Ardenticatenaceae bacterium]MCB8973530.1 flavodoxin [Ardenticatenaceae bacterium]